MMETYEFTVIATGLDPQDEAFEARFYDAGCDDALVSFQKGHILVDFCREAASLEEAIGSAVDNCREAGATVERVEPDPLVSLSEIAARSDMSRAAMTNYFKGHRSEGFPAPKARVTTLSPLWDWSDVSFWLYKHDKITKDIAIGAAVVSVANDILECSSGDFRATLHERVREKVAAF
jgi:hypothetical protein